MVTMVGQPCFALEPLTDGECSGGMGYVGASACANGECSPYNPYYYQVRALIAELYMRGSS